MTHPAEGTEGQTKASALKDKLAGLKGGGNGQSAPAVPANGGSKTAAPAAPAKKRTAKTEAAPKKEPAKAPAKAPAKKEPAKAPAKKEPAKAKEPKKEPAPRKAKRADGARTMDRDKEGDGLRPVEREIMKIVKQRRGKPISIREIAIAIHGEAKVTKADDGTTKDNVLVRTVRNGIRKPRDYGMLKLWTETGDPDAKNGYVVLGDGTAPSGAGTKAKKSAKAAAKSPAKKGGKKTPKKS